MTRRPRAAARQPREAILDAARHAFADKGYDHASIRAIATSAGVDPALISHYFGTGDQLHRSAMNVPVDPAALTLAIESAPRDELGAHIVRIALEVRDSPAGTAGMALH